jgi:hypothetical protein
MRFLVAIGLAAAALFATSTAVAADQSVVGAYGCFLQGGHVYRPAGTSIVARFGWAAKTRGLVQDYLSAQTTTFSVNGSASADVSGSYSAVDEYEPGGFVTWVYYDTGIVLAPGESMTFHTELSVAHRLLDGVVFENGEKGRPLFGGPGTLLDIDCTVTGV